MTDTPNDAIVLEDSDGNHYVIPYELIQMTRVEGKAEVAGDGEVAGYNRIAGPTFHVLGRLAHVQPNHWSRFRTNVGWPDDSAQPQGLGWPDDSAQPQGHQRRRRQ